MPAYQPVAAIVACRTAPHLRVQKRTFPKRKYTDVPNGLNQPFYLVRRTALETYFNPLLRCQTCCSPLHSEHMHENRIHPKEKEKVYVIQETHTHYCQTLFLYRFHRHHF